LADTLTLDAAMNTYRVPEGTPTLVTLQTGTFFVGNSGTLTGSFPFTITETVTINGDAQSITLSGTDNVTVGPDTLTVNAGPATTFPVANVLLIPQSLTAVGSGTVGQSLPLTLEAEVTAFATAVPEPSTLWVGVLGGGLAGLNALGRRRKTSVA
jgi:hypothetical protein